MLFVVAGDADPGVLPLCRRLRAASVVVAYTDHYPRAVAR
jgi:hypothetical protein